jgi:hypothetical protein
MAVARTTHGWVAQKAFFHAGLARGDIWRRFVAFESPESLVA